MKYRMLLSGSNRTIMNEFFTYMDFSFECLSCSDRYDDIVNHLKYIKPDVFVYCLHGEEPDAIKRFSNIGTKISKENIPIVIIGNDEDCRQFEEIAPLIGEKILRKPISSKSIESELLKMLGKRKQEENADAVCNTDTQSADFEKRVGAPAGTLPGAEDPIAAAMKILEKMDIQTTKSHARKHILVVDDDSSVLKLIKGYLSEQYDVATAINGRVAMKFLETKRTDLILLDYEMPGESGADVLNKIRANEKLKDLPVLFLTGVSDKERIREVLVLKPQGYLLKPIDMERLSATIESILA